jgi:nucleoside 2-deoxyribosyltransferase
VKTSGRDFLVYLSGPITGLTYDASQDWRDYVAKNLPQEIRSLSPLRAVRDALGHAGALSSSVEGSHPLASARGLTVADRFDCMRADVVLVNFLGCEGRVSIGTCMELGWADAARIPIILVMESSGNVHDHAMVREVSGFRVETLDAGMDLLESILIPEGRGTHRER